MPESKLFLIDAHALCYRSYFAIKSLSTTKGQATNAVYGFISTLRKIMREYGPEYMAICFDVGKKTHRQEKYAEYKIQRPSMPDDLISQIPIIKEVMEAFNLPIFELEGFEADDIIATIAQKMSKKNVEVVIVSDDKDMYQLVNSNVKIFSVRRDKMMDKKEAKSQIGFEPTYIADYIGLAGDKTDNIPGVMGIGEVTAKDLINKYGYLEDILKNVEKIKSAKVKEKLIEQKEEARFSKELAVLDTNVPIEFDLKHMKVGHPDEGRLFELFKTLEFRRLAEEFSTQSETVKNFKVKKADDAKDIKALKDKIQKKKECAFLIVNEEEQSKESVVVSLGGSDVYRLTKNAVVTLKEVFEDKDILKITHNIKGVMKTLAKRGGFLKGKMFDVMLAGYLLRPSQASYDISGLAWDHLKRSPSGENEQAAEVSLLYQLYAPMLKELKEKSLLKLLLDIEIPLAYVLYQMEATGVTLDQNLLQRLSKEFQVKIKQLEGRLYKLAGMEFNLNSPKQLSHVLFEKLKLPVIKKTKTGFSTNEEVLTRLAPQHELPALILEYRRLAKLKSTYIDALPKLINQDTGRLHASFNQAGTETGRLSSSSPNLQNIPIRTELGREIRKGFVPSKKGNMIMAADYSQVELRILAHLSKDKNLMKAFQTDEDIHNYTAALIFDVKEKDVTAQMRDSAKRVNFGIIYGMSAFGLSKDLGISQEEAQEFIDKYFLRYPKVKEFMDNEIKKCAKQGYVVTLLNRRRYIPEIKSVNNAVRQFAERQAINTPVQGSAADLLKLAMINIQQELEKKKLVSKMTITVHDELVFDVPEKEKTVMAELIREYMEHPLSLSVPIKVSIKAGKNWLDMTEIK